MDTHKNTISLDIDYGNGFRKQITDLRPQPALGKTGLDVFDVLNAASDIAPGLSYEFSSHGSDRVGNDIGALKSVDDVSAPGRKWRCRAGDFSGTELRRFTPVNTFTGTGVPAVKPGDHVSLELVEG